MYLLSPLNILTRLDVPWIFSNDGLNARFDYLLVSGVNTVLTITSEEYNQQPKAPLVSSPNIFLAKSKGLPNGTEDHDNLLFSNIQSKIKGKDEDDTYSVKGFQMELKIM